MRLKEISRIFPFAQSRETVTSDAFKELLTAPRFESMTLQIEESDFQIVDALSFYWSYREIFGEEMYEFTSSTDSPRIIDCGANCGLSVIYFKKRFPNASIAAVEADPFVFEVLRKNLKCRNLGDVELFQRAVTNSSGLMVDFHLEGADGGRVHRLRNSSQTVAVQTIKLDDLIDGPVDFLKMDVEGAEVEVLGGCAKLNQVNQLFVEYHSFADRPQDLDLLLGILKRHGFRYYLKTQFCSRQPLTEIQTQLGMDLQINVFAKKAV